MIRLLLSLLALLSGVAVQGAPAQALVHSGHDTQLNAPAQDRIAVHAVVRVATLAATPRAPAARAIGPARRLPPFRIAVRPGILIGIDRAHE